MSSLSAPRSRRFQPALSCATFSKPDSTSPFLYFIAISFFESSAGGPRLPLIRAVSPSAPNLVQVLLPLLPSYQTRQKVQHIAAEDMCAFSSESVLQHKIATHSNYTFDSKNTLYIQIIHVGFTRYHRKAKAFLVEQNEVHSSISFFTSLTIDMDSSWVDATGNLAESSIISRNDVSTSRTSTYFVISRVINGGGCWVVALFMSSRASTTCQVVQSLSLCFWQLPQLAHPRLPAPRLGSTLV